MIKEALQYLVELGNVRVINVNSSSYSTERLHRIDEEQRADAIEMHTLNSLVEYIHSKTDSIKDKLLVHVVSPIEVELISSLDSDRKRERLITVRANIPKIRFDSFLDQEEFIIMLQSCFENDCDREIVLQVAGSVVDNQVAEYGDDGISQKATIRQGIASSCDVKVPNPVVLVPIRTFQEVDQVEQKFVFRMKSERGLQCALFEADGGCWRNEAVLRIKNYLVEHLEGVDRITVIA